MLTLPDIDPVAFSVGPVKIHWYGIMYLIGFATAWWLGRRRAREPLRGWREESVDDLLFYVALGVIAGGRLGYVLFYDFAGFVDDPLSLVRIWRGGMSFHGGLLGVILAMWLYGRRHGHAFFEVADFVAPLVPIGIGLGRLGNFINGNLWGKPTDLPWGMVFRDPRAGGIARHPSQLYELALEGVVLFAIVWLFSRRLRPTMAVSGMFLLCYGIFRFLVEFIRQPDAHIGYLALDWVTMGQVLSVPMILAGALLLGLAYSGAGRTEPGVRQGGARGKKSS